MGTPHDFSDDPGQFPGPAQQSSAAGTVIIVIAVIGGVLLLMCGGVVALGVYAVQQVDDMMVEMDAQQQEGQQRLQGFQNASNNGDYQGALQLVEEAIAINEADSTAHNNKAWLLATCPDEQFRDGEVAVEHATKACELTEWINAGFIDTLAAAYAEAGNFEAAAEWQQKAIDANTNGFYAAEFNQRLAMYKAETPYREGTLVERQMEMRSQAEAEAIEAVESVFGDLDDETKPE